VHDAWEDSFEWQVRPAAGGEGLRADGKTFKERVGVFGIVALRGPEDQSRANRDRLVRRFVARLRCGGRASGRPVHRAGSHNTVYLSTAQYKAIRK